MIAEALLGSGDVAALAGTLVLAALILCIGMGILAVAIRTAADRLATAVEHTFRNQKWHVTYHGPESSEDPIVRRDEETTP